jgi:hypothetical protein
MTKRPRTCVECGTPTVLASVPALCPTCALRAALGGPQPRAGDAGGPSPDVERGTPGQRVQDFELLDEIGRGGMGVVYRAYQPSLDRIVAIKMLLPGSASAESLRRFRTEASVAAGLQHPGVVAIHEVGVWQGQPYIVMDLVEGESFAERIASRRGQSVDVRQVARWMCEIADAVQHAHEHGILHRDLKPSNVLIDDRGRARVTDFGLAKHLGVGEQTLPGQVLGSPSFMPPEQAGGRGPVSARSDVYALGATLYQGLTGNPPFQGETPSAVLHDLFTRDPVPPRRLVAAVPRDLETICLKCLEKDPARRYESAAAFANDLRRFLDGDPIVARPRGTPERLWRSLRKRQRTVAAAALLVLAGWLGWQAFDSSRQLRREATERAIDAAIEMAWGGDHAGAEGATADAERLGAPPEWLHMLRGLAALYRMANASAVREFEAAVASAPDNVAARAMLSNAVLNQGHYDRYEELAARLAHSTPRTARDHLLLGSALLVSFHDTAIPVALLTEAVRRHPSGVAFAQLALAEAIHAQDTGNWAVARQATAHADTAFEIMGAAHPAVRCVGLQTLNAQIRLCSGTDCDPVRERAAVLVPGTCSLQRALYFEAIGDADAELHQWQTSVRLTRGRGVYGNYYAAAMLSRGLSAEALAELAAAPEATDPFALAARAYLSVDAGRLDDAETLYRRAADSRGSSRVVSEGALLLLGEVDRVAANARTLLELMTADHPSRPVIRFWAGEIDEAALLASAGTSRATRGSVRHAAGLASLGQGDRAAAAAHFRAAVADGIPLQVDYHWSRAFLARLLAEPDWPGRLRDR